MPSVERGPDAGDGGVLLDLRTVGDPVAVRDLADQQAGTAEVTEFHVPTLARGSDCRPATQSTGLGVGEQPVDLLHHRRPGCGAPGRSAARRAGRARPSARCRSPTRNATGWMTSAGCAGGTSTVPVRSTTPLRPPASTTARPSSVKPSTYRPSVSAVANAVVLRRHDDPAGPVDRAPAAPLDGGHAARGTGVRRRSRLDDRHPAGLVDRDPAAARRRADTQASPSENEPTPRYRRRVDQQPCRTRRSAPTARSPAGAPRPRPSRNGCTSA